jgi:hypothetical protein
MRAARRGRAGVRALPREPDRIVGVRLRFNETQLREQVRAGGAALNAATRLWRMPLRTATHIGLLDRVVQN